MDAPAPAVRRACSCAWPTECSEMVDSCLLGHKFVKIGCRDGSYQTVLLLLLSEGLPPPVPPQAALGGGPLGPGG